MSTILDTAACSDAQRREDLARNDAAMAHGISRVSLAKVSGQHLSAAANEPSEEDWVQFDCERNVNKGERLAARNDSAAMDLQVQFAGYIGELPRG